MAIIVQHLTTGNEYIFLGVIGGESKNILPTKMLGDFFATETPDKSRSLTVCDDQGRILSPLPKLNPNILTIGHRN